VLKLMQDVGDVFGSHAPFYASAHSIVNASSHYSVWNTRRMRWHELVNALVTKAGGSFAVARAMRRPTFQGTLHKIATGKVESPSRQSAERIATHFKIDVNALYNDRIAIQEATRLGLVGDISEFGPRAIKDLEPFPQGEITHSTDSFPTSTVRAYGDTTLVRAPIVEWARLGDDVLKDPSELGGAEVLDYVQIGTPGRRAKLVPVVDDSLAPRLIVGDMVAIDPDNTCPKRGQVALFRSSVDGEFFLRRYQPLAAPDFEAVDAKGAAMDSRRHGLEIVGVNCGMRPSDL